MGFCNCSMFCCPLLCVNSSFAIIFMGKRELIDLLCLSSWYLVIVVLLFLTIPQVSLQFVFVVFPDHTHLLFLTDLQFYQNTEIHVSVNLFNKICNVHGDIMFQKITYFTL